MKITTKKENTCHILSISGRLDTQTSPDLENDYECLFRSGEVNFIFDLSNVDYISSSGLRIFLLAQKQVRNKGGSVIIVGLKDFLFELFHISGFTTYFTFHETCDDALASFN